MYQVGLKLQKVMRCQIVLTRFPEQRYNDLCGVSLPVLLQISPVSNNTDT
jgi:hypothetical protein